MLVVPPPFTRGSNFSKKSRWKLGGQISRLLSEIWRMGSKVLFTQALSCSNQNALNSNMFSESHIHGNKIFGTRGNFAKYSRKHASLLFYILPLIQTSRHTFGQKNSRVIVALTISLAWKIMCEFVHFPPLIFKLNSQNFSTFPSN